MRAPSEIVEGLSSAWDRWILKALESLPENRYRDAAEMLEAMPADRSSDSEATIPQPAKPTATETKHVKPGTKTRGMKGLWIGLVLVLLLSGAFGYNFGVVTPKRERLEPLRTSLATARGGIVVRTEPAGALVTIGSLTKKRKSPFTLKEVKPGAYPVTIEATGYETWSGRIRSEGKRTCRPRSSAVSAQRGSLRSDQSARR